MIEVLTVSQGACLEMHSDNEISAVFLKLACVSTLHRDLVDNFFNNYDESFVLFLFFSGLLF